ncbi:hypothetical protein [Thiospirillum jenense]|uniref:Uncharacterized protein n=1 Tax=Thiospirillum jenense TaxID=1653858 RepID=A0A839HKE5_9GAMM|nr:hypothetical protein [Thiospirillum jenense]MBB1126342.1 hypothetical protein [Thiospirillum jenense]
MINGGVNNSSVLMAMHKKTTGERLNKKRFMYCPDKLLTLVHAPLLLIAIDLMPAELMAQGG